jgi:hypothetical protein
VNFSPVGEAQTKTHFYSFLKDSKIQNATTTDKHMDRLIKILKKKNVLKDRLYETTDGCGAQYRSTTALWFLSALSAKLNIIIGQSFGAPGHGKLLLNYLLLFYYLFLFSNKIYFILYIGFVILFCTGKGVVDGVNGTDKNLLIRYSARELQEAMDSIKKDEKRFAAHSVNKDGKEFSLAEECARLLRIGREDGIKSQGKSKKERGCPRNRAS